MPAYMRFALLLVFVDLLVTTLLMASPSRWPIRLFDLDFDAYDRLSQLMHAAWQSMHWPIHIPMENSFYSRMMGVAYGPIYTMHDGTPLWVDILVHLGCTFQTFAFALMLGLLLVGRQRAIKGVGGTH